MKREILLYKPKSCGCCPGHDDYPTSRYGVRGKGGRKTLKRLRRMEKRHARSISKRNLRRMVVMVAY